MKQVDPVIYSGVSRGERRRIAKQLAGLKARREAALAMAAQLAWGGNKDLARALEAANAIPPIGLLACIECARPTALCTCVDSAGDPLNWGSSGAVSSPIAATP